MPLRILPVFAVQYVFIYKFLSCAVYCRLLEKPHTSVKLNWQHQSVMSRTGAILCRMEVLRTIIGTFVNLKWGLIRAHQWVASMKQQVTVLYSGIGSSLVIRKSSPNDNDRHSNGSIMYPVLYEAMAKNYCGHFG
ncbi:uncharacterized protein LOC110681548 [Aedes aegypti]|uniref:Uncharacterized protein n=1 Tax=Aedes aegypti TaxID=7159 RepID=A0A6I8U6R2_AEDAE|nr:uncharacterized protein LOC110674614 [Aedes aegypti]XP_021713289.1 uncharacterized protein LOC110681548 [Aedes aegypti]